jgi:hypothetical protein
MFVREGGNVRTHFTPPEDFVLAAAPEIAAGRLDPWPSSTTACATCSA